MLLNLIVSFILAAVIGVGATPVFKFPDFIRRANIPIGIDVEEFNATAAALGEAAAPELKPRESSGEQSNCKGSRICRLSVTSENCAAASSVRYKKTPSDTERYPDKSLSPWLREVSCLDWPTLTHWFDLPLYSYIIPTSIIAAIHRTFTNTAQPSIAATDHTVVSAADFWDKCSATSTLFKSMLRLSPFSFRRKIATFWNKSIKFWFIRCGKCGTYNIPVKSSPYHLLLRFALLPYLVTCSFLCHLLPPEHTTKLLSTFKLKQPFI